MAEGGIIYVNDECKPLQQSEKDASFKNIHFTCMAGGTAQNVIGAGIIHGDVSVATEEYLRNLEDQTLDDMAVWTEGMVRVSAVDTVIQKLQNGNNWVTITGNAGEGKTTLGYMVLERLMKEGNTVFKLDTPQDYIHVVRKRRNSVIMLNDVFGAFTFDSTALSSWLSVIRHVIDIHAKSKENNRTRVLFVSRRNVLEGARDHLGGYAETILGQTCVVDLSQIKQFQERREILEYYLANNGLSVTESVKKLVVFSNVPHGFPHCCKIYVQLVLKGEDIDIQRFFASPLQFLDQTTRVLVQKQNLMTLFKTMIMHDGKLDISIIDNDQQRDDAQTATLELTGSYVRKGSGKVVFSHPSIYESVVSVIGERDLVFILGCASISLLLQKVDIEPNDQTRLPGFINVDPHSNELNILVGRFRPLVLKRNFFIFRNQRLCRSQKFCEELVKGITRKTRISPFKRKQKLCINDTDGSGQTMLYAAEQRKDFTAVRVLLENGADVNKAHDIRSFNGMSTFHFACDWNAGNIEHLRLLLKHGADVNKVDNSGFSPLHYLCTPYHPNVSAIELIIEKGGSVNKFDNQGKTALHYLCMHAQPDLEAIELLIKHGAIVNRGLWVGPALNFLCSHGKSDVSAVELLVKHGAEVNRIALRSGQTALLSLCSAYEADVSLVEWLIKHGGDVNRIDWHGRTTLFCLCDSDNPDISAMEMLIENGADVNRRCLHGFTALHRLCCKYKPKVEAIELLLDHGINVNCASRKGRTALHCLCSRDRPNINAIELLIKHGIDVNKGCDHGTTALLHVCSRDKPDPKVIELLLTNGATVNKTNNHGGCALHGLCHQIMPSIDAMELLISHGIDVNVACKCGMTALHSLCNKEVIYRPAFNLLIEHGADVKKACINGMALLHGLCNSDQPDVGFIELVIQQGSDVNGVCKRGRTPLHFLCNRNDPDVSAVELLIKHGADVNKPCKRRWTPLRYLCLHDQPDLSVIELLIKNGADVTKAWNPRRTVPCVRGHQRPNDDVTELLMRYSVNVDAADDDRGKGSYCRDQEEDSPTDVLIKPRVV